MEAIKIGEHELQVQDVTKALQDGGFIVRSKEDDSKAMKSFLDGLSHEDERVNHLIGPVTRRERESFEATVKELTGMDKISVDGRTETALDYAKRAFGETKKSLEDKANEGVKDAELKTKYDTVVNDFDQYKKETEKIRQNHKLELQQFEIKSIIDAEANKLRFKDGIDPELLKTFTNHVKQEVLDSKPQKRTIGNEELLVLVEDSGSIRYAEDGNPLTIDRFLTGKLSKYLHEDRVITGSGTEKPDTSGKTSQFVMDPTIDSKPKLVKALLDAGLKDGSEEYMKLYKEYSKDLPAVRV